jgi:S-ribosylhomocysteine lyase
MEKIESFKVNHLNLLPGLYLSRQDGEGESIVSTYDLRFTAPNREKVLDNDCLHAVEHLGATFFRNSDIKNSVVYFGPMGCRTGFYLLLFGEKSTLDIYQIVLDFCDFVLGFTGEIPGASAIECGNYTELNLEKAKIAVKNYKEQLVEYKRLSYV